MRFLAKAAPHALREAMSRLLATQRMIPFAQTAPLARLDFSKTEVALEQPIQSAHHGGFVLLAKSPSRAPRPLRIVPAPIARLAPTSPQPGTRLALPGHRCVQLDKSKLVSQRHRLIAFVCNAPQVCTNSRAALPPASLAPSARLASTNLADAVPRRTQCVRQTQFAAPTARQDHTALAAQATIHRFAQSARKDSSASAARAPLAPHQRTIRISQLSPAASQF